jgi:chitinase
MNNGLYQPFTGGGSSISYSDLEASYVNKMDLLVIGNPNPESKVPWLFNGTQFVSYDYPDSLGYKTSFIKSMGLGGGR